MQGDLADIKGHYELVPNGEFADPSGPNGDLQPSGPKAFWVVEATHKITGRRELAGCGGIGTQIAFPLRFSEANR